MDNTQLFLMLVAVLTMWSVILFNAIKDNQPSEALKLEAAAVRFCNKQHYPVDLNFEAWKQCLKEFEVRDD